MDTRLTDYITEVDNRGMVLRLLASGSRQAQVARIVGVSRQYVSRLARKAVREGKIKRISTNPATYTTCQPSGSPSALKPLFKLHRIGFAYFLHRKNQSWAGFTEHTRNGWSQWTRREPGMTIIAYKNKIHFWVTLTPNTSVEKQMEHSKQLVKARAQQIAQEYGNRLSYDRSLAPPEAEFIDKGVIELLTKGMDVKHTPIDLGGSEIVVDRSHENPEIRGVTALDRAKAIEFFSESGMKHMQELFERQNKILQELVDIRQQLDHLMSKEVR